MSSLSRVTAGMILITATIVGGSMSALALLKRGTNGETVKVLQQKLRAKNLYSGPRDGKFGGGTERAVIKFQERNDLEPDGKAGDETWRKLTGAPKKPILKRNEGPAVSVRTLQRKLGFKEKDVDGIFGGSTEAAVKRFQRRNGIVDNGVVESDMRYMLNWGR